MTDPLPDDRLTQSEQRQQRQDAVVAQIHEILLLTAQRQERNAAQIEANTEAIAELRAILRDRYSNGQSGDCS